MLTFLLIVTLSIVASLITAIVIMLGWVCWQTALDVMDARRRRLDDLAVRDAVERNRKR